MKDLRIQNLKQLKELCRTKHQLDCYVAFNGGCKSSKTFLFSWEGFVIIHEIDDTEEEFNSFDDLLKNEYWKEVFNKKALFVYSYEVKLK